MPEPMNLEEELMAAGELSEAPQLPTDVSSREFDEWLEDIPMVPDDPGSVASRLRFHPFEGRFWPSKNAS